MNRGLLASELINLLNNLIDKYGDLEVYKETNGNTRPIYFGEYYPLEKHFELT